MGRPTVIARTITLIVSGIYSLILFTIGFELPSWLRFLISFLPTLAVILVVVWDLWIWRLPFVQGLVRRPDLRGLWRVSLTPQKDSHIPAGGNWGPIDGFMEVRQSFWGAYMRLYTAESSSRSTATTWQPTYENAVDSLTFIYENTPKAAQSDRSPRSTGTCSLYPASLKPKEIEGVYFTDRFTKGDMTLVFVGRETGHASFAAALRYSKEVVSEIS